MVVLLLPLNIYANEGPVNENSSKPNTEIEIEKVENMVDEMFHANLNLLTSEYGKEFNLEALSATLIVAACACLLFAVASGSGAVIIVSLLEALSGVLMPAGV